MKSELIVLAKSYENDIKANKEKIKRCKNQIKQLNELNRSYSNELNETYRILAIMAFKSLFNHKAK